MKSFFSLFLLLLIVSSCNKQFSMLKDNTRTTFDWQGHLKQLGFLPAIFSPYYELVNKNMLDTLHQAGVQVIPWTVNETSEMERLQALGVDGIITDYPDRIPRN